MSGEIFERSAPEASIVAADELDASETEVRAHEKSHMGVALLLTAAAFVAALVGVRAAMISSSATDSWQSALRADVKRSAGAMDDVRQLYAAEFPIAVKILEARTLEAQYRAAAQNATGATQAQLLLEADTQHQIIVSLSPSCPLATDPAYALPGGGIDLARALRDLRAQNPSLVSLDPDALQTAGDRLANQAELMTMALMPTSGAAFLGVLAQAFRPRRRVLLSLGTLALAGGVLMALAVEVLA